MVPSFSSASTPTIDEVSGNIATGQALTITGVNMVQENTANWIKNYSNTGAVMDEAYFNGCTGSNFEHGESPCHQWKFDFAGAPLNTAAIDTSNYLVGNRSVKLSQNTDCVETQSCGACAIYHSSSPPQNFYASAYVKFNGNFASHYQKFFLTVGGSAQFYVNQGLNGDGTANGVVLKDGLWGAGDPLGSFSWTKNKWHYWEILIDTTSYSGDKYTVWWDGERVAEYLFPGHSGAEPTFKELGIVNWSNATAPFTMWVSRYVISSSRIYPASTIEVSGDGIDWKYQEPLYLSDASSQIKLDLSGLTGTNYQLRVRNNKQETSPIYFLTDTPLDNAAPASPTGLIIE